MLEPDDLLGGRKAEGNIWTAVPPMQNFFDAIRERDHKVLKVDIEVGVRSAAYAHLANIAYRVKRTLKLAQSTGRFVGDEEANALLTRNYRAPYVVPERV